MGNKMIKKPACFLSFLLICGIAAPALAADEKIDPATYNCAAFVTSSIDGTPPLFEGLQLDGYAAAQGGVVIADANTLQPMLLAVSDSCASKPAETAISHWKEMRKYIPYPDEGQWRADKTTCADYAANEDDGSGFVIWLDAYNRAKTGKAASVFDSQEKLDQFLNACKASPDSLMLDVLAKNAK